MADKIKITVFWTDHSGDKDSIQNLHEQYLRRMNELVKKYGLSTTVRPATRSTKFMLPFTGTFIENPEYEAEECAGKLRNMANKVYPGKDSERAGTVVIYCPFAPTQLQRSEQRSRDLENEVKGQ